MLPFYTNINKSKNAIFINPNFRGQLPSSPISASFQSTSVIPKSTHINPLFLESQKYRNTIHMNPAFLQKFQEHQQQQHEIVKKYIPESDPKKLYQATDIAVKPCDSISAEPCRMICKSRRRLIREPLMKNSQVSNLSVPSSTTEPLLVLNKRKLVRKTSTSARIFDKPVKKSFEDPKANTRYKLDNREIGKKTMVPQAPKIKRTSYVGRYALKRTLSEISNRSEEQNFLYNKNKNCQFLNINGLLYKSTQNSLKLKDISAVRILKSSKSNRGSSKRSSNASQSLIIFDRGNKYVMYANKLKLTRVTNHDHTSSKSSSCFKAPYRQRVDIGGYTCVTINSTKNVLKRTTNHLSRAYAHNAKQKSLQMLKKSLVKSNIPCPIFQRIGKCASFERGKCTKVHNKLQIAICSKFLRGECLNRNCLLSHNVSLSKMPVCKFFLQGICVRNDCPYLHKKLSNSVELCHDFLRGFCQMADKCNKRHEFICPEIERNNICNTKNCTYCNAKRRKQLQTEIKSEKENNTNSSTALSAENSSPEVIENQSCKRYFINSCDKTIKIANETNLQLTNENTADNNDTAEPLDENIENSLRIRPKLGALPAYIPL